MELKQRINVGEDFLDVIYNDTDSFSELPVEQIGQHYGVCFYGDRIVVGWDEKAGLWSLIGGTVEKGEDINETLVREVKEESNMRVIEHHPIGFQKLIKADGSFVYQLRSFCIVEPIAEFEGDPAGNVTKIALIDPKDWDQYISWGSVGKRILERALEIDSRLKIKELP